MFKQQPQEIISRQNTIKQESQEKIFNRIKTKYQQIDFEKSKAWIENVFDTALKVSADIELEVDPPQPMEIPKEISAYVVQTILRLLSCRNDLYDNGLYFLNDAGTSLGLQPQEMRNLLDDEFDHLRVYFTERLLKELNQEQRHWCALILMKIICADGQIHPAEKVYFDIITKLMENDPKSFEKIKAKAKKAASLPKLKLQPDTARTMLKYVVTIAMCDGEYVGQESEFVKLVANSLDIDEAQVDTILQPVASSFMVIQSLFPKRT